MREALQAFSFVRAARGRPASFQEVPVTQHPELHLVHARCSTCGATHTFRSTAGGIAVEVCSSCHPAYTGGAQAAASGSRIERFNRRRALAAA